MGELFDITKAFDHLQLSVIHKWAVHFEFPMTLLRLLFVVYRAPRHFVIGKGMVMKVFPTRSTVAGCAFADLMMANVMLGVHASVMKAAPQAIVAVIADDFQILTVGKR